MSLRARFLHQDQRSRCHDHLLVVDDLIFIGNNPSMFKEFKNVTTNEFEITDIGLIAYYHGIEVKRKKKGIFILQESYAKEILKTFKMDDCKPISTPIECEIKLSKDDEAKKGESVTLQKSSWKFIIFDLYKAWYSLCNWTCESLHGNSDDYSF